MSSLIDPVLESVDTLLAWFSSGLATTIQSNCDIQTADGPLSLVTNDGSLCTIMKVEGVTSIVGKEEFESIHKGLVEAFSPFMSIDGHGLQVVYTYSKDKVHELLSDNYAECRATCKTLNLDLSDLLEERLTSLFELHSLFFFFSLPSNLLRLAPVHRLEHDFRLVTAVATVLTTLQLLNSNSHVVRTLASPVARLRQIQKP